MLAELIVVSQASGAHPLLQHPGGLFWISSGLGNAAGNS